MWTRLEKQINVERTALRRAIETHRPLIDKVRTETPTPIEVSALAALLHSFYPGIENICKRITVELGDSMPEGNMWHALLLDSMTAISARRPAVLSRTLAQRLRLYLDFRHVFRHAYPFDLRWSKMAALVLDCEAVLLALEDEIDRFVISGKQTDRSEK